MPRKAVIGPEVVVAVDARTKRGMARAEAFREVAAERGMNTSAVAATYYRTVRRSAGGPAPASGRRRVATTRRRTSSKGRTVARRARGTASAGPVDMNRLTADIVSAANALAAAARSQAREVVELRARLDQARATLN